MSFVSCKKVNIQVMVYDLKTLEMKADQSTCIKISNRSFIMNVIRNGLAIAWPPTWTFLSSSLWKTDAIFFAKLSEFLGVSNKPHPTSNVQFEINTGSWIEELW